SFDLSSDLLPFDLSFSSLDAPSFRSDSAPDPVIDQGPVPTASFDGNVVAQAWSDWAEGLDLGAFDPQPTFPVFEQPAGEEFDLFEFLRQDAAAGSAAEVVC
ncbi:hypothetical protein JCM11641_004321, partial [Rhodosporidiobolus odoratus]